MSNSIWKTPDQKPEPDAGRWIYVKPSPIFPYGVSYRHTITAGCLVKAEWAYIDDLIAQADKAERLQMKVDVLEHINDSWAKYCGQKIKTDSTVAESRQITYMTDGRTKVYYGQNGTQIETNLPLPVGFVITINETTNDK